MQINNYQNEKNIFANVNHQNIDFHFHIINVNFVITQSINKFSARSAHKRLNIENNSQNILNITIIN